MCKARFSQKLFQSRIVSEIFRTIFGQLRFLNFKNILGHEWFRKLLKPISVMNGSEIFETIGYPSLSILTQGRMSFFSFSVPLFRASLLVCLIISQVISEVNFLFLT